jgi:hypothetical protein
MDSDKLMNELKKAWIKLDNSLVARTPIEGPAMVEETPKEEPEAQQIADNLRTHSKDIRLGDFN